MFDLMNDEILIATIFIPVIVVLLLLLPIIVRGISIRHKNNNSPRLSVPVKIVTKRAHINVSNGDSHTTYYVTFEAESGDRTEFRVSGREYGSMVEGDQGKLTFQGTRYISFDRDFKKTNHYTFK